MDQRDNQLKLSVLAVACVHVLVIAIPLVVYIMFWFLAAHHHDFSELLKKPEWMFIALMLQIEATRDTKALAAEYKLERHFFADANFLLDIVLLIMFAVILFAALASYEHMFELRDGFGVLQSFVLLGVALHCIWLKYQLLLLKHWPSKQTKAQERIVTPNP